MDDTEVRWSHVPPMSHEKNKRFVGEFAERQRDKLIKRFIRTGETEQDAQDLVNEALSRFVETFGSVEALPSESVCAAWLATTATNLYRDQLRKRRTQRKMSPKLRLANDPPLELDETEASEKESLRREQLTQIIQELTPTTRAALELKVNGSTGREIAQALDIKEGTARKRIHDAVRKLFAAARRFRDPGGH